MSGWPGDADWTVAEVHDSRYGAQQPGGAHVRADPDPQLRLACAQADADGQAVVVSPFA